MKFSRMDDIVQENDDRIDRLTRYQQAGFRKMEALEKPLVHNLGATGFDIIRLLLTQYTKMVLLSFILAVPVAITVIEKWWLQGWKVNRPRTT